MKLMKWSWGNVGKEVKGLDKSIAMGMKVGNEWETINWTQGQSRKREQGEVVV